MSKLASVLAAAAGVAAFAYLTGPSPSTVGTTPGVQNSSSHPISKGATAWRANPSQPAPAPLADRTKLASAIETELHRLGCYAGPSNGAWAEDARRAMSAVASHAAVRLPVQQPDYILLTLARRLPGPVCNQPCVNSAACITTAQRTPQTTTALVPTSGEIAPRAKAPIVAQRKFEPWRATVKEPGQPLRAKREAERIALADRQRRLVAEKEGRSSEAHRNLQLAEQQRTAELALLEARRRQDADAPVARAASPEGRMSLGVVQLPKDTRDAPLPSVAMAPVPGIPAADALTTVAPAPVGEVVRQASKRQREASVQPIARPPSPKRKAWTRTIFQDISRNGP